PASRSLILIARRDLRRAAALGWIAPDLAARSSALIASASVACGSPSPGVVATSMARRTRVFAAVRRGPRISWRRSELLTRFSPEGERAPVHLRGVLAKSMQPLHTMWIARARIGRRARGRIVAEGAGPTRMSAMSEIDAMRRQLIELLEAKGAHLPFEAAVADFPTDAINRPLP